MSGLGLIFLGGGVSRPDGLIELPNGERIFYDDDAHRYSRARLDEEKGEWVRSTRLTSASTLARPYGWDHGKLLAWKERLTCEGVAELYRSEPSEQYTPDGWQPNHPDWLANGDAIRSKLREASLTADDARNKKAEVGTNVHRVLEGLAGVAPLPNLDELPEGEKGYARAVFRWWEHRRPIVLNAEQFVFSATHSFAGRFDLRARLTEPRDDVTDADGVHWVTLIDLKTGFVGPQAHTQMALYALAAQECGVGYCDELMILQVKEDGAWREIPCRATEGDALHSIGVYRGAGRIEREARAA